MRKVPPRMSRGFTLVELMIVVGVIGILASIAIPNYQKLTARSRRAEMLTAVSKFKMFFKNAYDSNGTFVPAQTWTSYPISAVNPDPTTAPLGIPANWDPTRDGWLDIPFGLEGGILMRYEYKVNSPTEMEFLACGSFPAFGPVNIDCQMGGVTGNYLYDEVFEGNGTSTVVEFPNSF